MTVATFIGALALFCLVLVAALSFDRAKGIREGLSGVGGLLTLAAVLVGVYWYIDRRPDAAKVEIEIAATVNPIPNRQVLVLSEVRLKNIGESALSFGPDESLRIFVQEVTPVAPAIMKKLMPSGSEAMVEPAANWNLLRKGKISLDGTLIEAGESDFSYFRAVVPCEPNLRLYVSVRLKKKRRGQDTFGFLRQGGEDILYERQALVDGTGLCSAKGGKR